AMRRTSARQLCVREPDQLRHRLQLEGLRRQLPRGLPPAACAPGTQPPARLSQLRDRNATLAFAAIQSDRGSRNDRHLRGRRGTVLVRVAEHDAQHAARALADQPRAAARCGALPGRVRLLLCSGRPDPRCVARCRPGVQRHGATRGHRDLRTGATRSRVRIVCRRAAQSAPRIRRSSFPRNAARGVSRAANGVSGDRGRVTGRSAATGSATSQQERLARAAQTARQRPRDYAALMEYAVALHAIGHSSEALEPADAAHALRPWERDPVEMRAVALLDRVEIEAGLAMWRELDARFAPDADTRHRRLIFGYYDPAQTNAGLYEAVREHVRSHIRPFGPAFRAAVPADPERTLRIGWISPRFGHGPVASFLGGLLDAFDRERFRHVTIALREPFDDTGRKLFERGDETVIAGSLDDTGLLDRLRDARLDIA